MTEVSLNFREQAYAQETGVVVICLITITHASLAEPIRISTDPTARLIETEADVIYGTLSRGEQYFFFPCALKLPDDTDEGPGPMSLTFDNVTRDYIAIIRSIVGPPAVKVEMILSNALDDVEAQWPEFLLTHIKYDAATVTATMVLETLEREPFPAGSFDPSRAPGLF